MKPCKRNSKDSTSRIEMSFLDAAGTKIPDVLKSFCDAWRDYYNLFCLIKDKADPPSFTEDTNLPLRKIEIPRS